MNFIIDSYEAEIVQGEINDFKIGFSASNSDGESLTYSAKVFKKDLSEGKELKDTIMNDVTVIAMNKLKSYIAATE
ncbi:hypothetical protein [Liquorilactobacillus mali]|uniref:Uncharacterized protein n=1 Tax=Liquorilactobacillus mali KCTC 3596 = DSM 20444 TaxID=1046596 RepID=J0UPZ7_9LACO|nr:hypothetical protein [Liquorilactobacillus mali]EJE97756.1 hypothetical protein LMA_09203 [Liquorilactobacillus mali KCTC 3596 = DSM 20444]KRN10833.1 hypothetical protein FD00_GL002076 [Liquorilactobacillus mali KCTC 3596 = DSM 20444]